IPVRDGLCHANEPRGSARWALHGFLSTAAAGAGAVRGDPRAADLGGRHPADLCAVGGNFAALPQTPAEDIAVVGGRIVFAAHPSQLDLPSHLFHALPPPLDGTQAAGHAEALRGRQYLRAWNGAADPGPELGGMEAGVARPALRHLCGGSISA